MNHPWCVLLALGYVSSSAVSPLVVSTGSSVTLTFQVQADPAPSVQWFFNGSLIQTNITYQTRITPANNIIGSTLNNVTLLIGSMNISTQGYYYATITNGAGTRNSSSVFATPPGRVLADCHAASSGLLFSLPTTPTPPHLYHSPPFPTAPTPPPSPSLTTSQLLEESFASLLFRPVSLWALQSS